jgi:hypothetical protein
MSVSKKSDESTYNPVGAMVVPSVKNTRRAINKIRRQLRKEIQIQRNQQAAKELESQLNDIRRDNMTRANGGEVYPRY